MVKIYCIKMFLFLKKEGFSIAKLLDSFVKYQYLACIEVL